MSENPPIRGKKKKVVNENVRDKILERVAREEKAYRIVERFIDNPISLKLLQKSLRYINQDSYNDIVEERSIFRNCGYPLCEAPLPTTTRKQTYSIDSRNRKVYKLEDLAKFCSSPCFSFSRQLRDQITQEPLWLMSRSANQNISVVPVKPAAESGEQDEDLPRNIKIDEKYLRSDDEPRAHVNLIRERTVRDRSSVDEPRIKQDADISEIIKQQFSWLELEKEEDLSEEEVPTNIPTLSLLGTLQHCLLQWRTTSSVEYLTSRADTSPNILDSDDDEEDEEGDLLDEDLKISGPANKAPLPSISELNNTDVKITENTDTETAVHLPNIDSIHQVRQRHNIVLTQLQQAISRLLTHTPFTYSEVSCVVVRLVSLLNISSTTCMFTERGWTVLGAVVLDGCYGRLGVISRVLDKERFRVHLFSQIASLLEDEDQFVKLCKAFCDG